MPTVPYTQIADDSGELSQRVSASLASVSNINPNAAAEAQQLSKLTGLPYQSVLDNPGYARNQAQRDQAADYAYTRANPVLMNHLANPAFAALAKDNLDPLEKIGTTLTGLGQSVGTGAIGGVSSTMAGVRGITEWSFLAPQEAVSEKPEEAFGYDFLKGFTQQLRAGEKVLNRQAAAIRPTTDDPTLQAVYSGTESLTQNIINFLGAGKFALAPMILQTFGQSYAKGRESGLSVNEAFRYGGVDALVEYATEKIPFMKFLGDVKAGAPFWKVLKHQLMTEVPGEQVATFFQDLNEFASLHPDKPMSEFWAQRPDAAYQTLIATSVGVMGMSGAGHIMGQIGKRQQAEEYGKLAADLTSQSKESELRKRSPEAFSNFLKSHVEGGPVESVYIKREDLVDLFNQGAINRQALEAALPDVGAQLDNLFDTADIVIPTQDYFTHVAPEYGDVLNQHLRADPGADSIFDLKEKQAFHEQMMKETWDKVMSNAETAQEFADSAARLEKTFYETNRDTLLKLNKNFLDAKQVAKAEQFAKDYAVLVRDAYVQLAAQEGVTPEQYFEAHPFQIKWAETPAVAPETVAPEVLSQQVLQDLSETKLKPQTEGEKAEGYAQAFKNPVTLSNGSRLSGFTDPVEQTTFYGYDKNGEKFTIRREYVAPEDIVSSAHDNNRTATLVKEGLMRVRQAAETLQQRLPADKKWRNWEPEVTSTGKIKGAPEWVNNKADLNKLRGDLRKFAKEGLTGRYWYENSAKAIMAMVRGDVVKAEKFIQLLAIYSPNSTVWVNTIQAVRAYSHWMSGKSESSFSVGSGAHDKVAKALLYEGKNWEGRKTNSFYINLMHDIIEQYPGEVEKMNLGADVLNELKATIDVWMGRGFGYDNAAFANDKGSGKYSFAENEVRRMAAEFNEKLAEGEPRWTPHQVQAAIWTAVKTRYEFADVKDKTNRKSLREKLIKIVDGKMVYPKDAETYRKHLANWRHFAMQKTTAEVTAAAEEGGRSFGDDLQRMTEVVTWEANPSTAFGYEINNASPAVLANFTAEARGLLLDENGNDMLAMMFNVPLAFSTFGYGGYEGAVSPNVLSHLLPMRVKGEGFPVDEVRAYALAIQYIFKQDAAPWFRPDNKPITSQAGIEDQKFKAVSKNGRTIRKFDTQAEAEAFAKEKGYDVRGGKMSRGVVVRFDAQLDENKLNAILKALQATLGEDAGYTRTAADEITIINFRDDETKVPFARTDEDFQAAVQTFVTKNHAALGIFEANNIWSEGEYGYVHDWKQDAEGRSILERGLSGRSDLHAWLRDRRNAFDQLIERYSGQALVNAERAAGLLYQSGPARRRRSIPFIQDWADEISRDYGERREGVTPVVGVHFSGDQRESLSGFYYGKGMPGEESRRVARSEDKRISQRLHFYVDEGQGIVPEISVGHNVHALRMNNLYNTAEDPLGLNVIDKELSRDERMNALESAVLNAGYDGIYVPGAQDEQGVAVLLGEHTVEPSYHGLAYELNERVEARQRLGQQVRGAYSPSTLTALLYQDADFSTALHEFSHFLTDMYFGMATQPGATPQVMQMTNTLLDWFKVPDLATWNSMTIDQRRPYYEQFAYNWENYLFEGKAPSPELKTVFRRFTAFLKRIYKSIKEQLNVAYKQEFGKDLPILTGEVRQVMDLMLAADQQYKRAEETEGEESPWTTKPEGMDDDQWAAFQLMQQDAREEGMEQLTRSTLRYMKQYGNARGRVLRNIQGETKTLRDKIRAEVEAEMRVQPEYITINFLKTGEVPQAPGLKQERRALVHKLLASAVKDLYPAGRTLTAAPDWKKLGYGKNGMLVTKEGLTPDQVANIFKILDPTNPMFSSGDALVRHLVEVQPIETAIEARTDQRMLEEHSDMLEPGNIDQRVREALHNDLRAQMNAVVYRFLNKVNTPVRVINDVVKQIAQRTVLNEKIGTLKPRNYSLAANRASKDVARLISKGETEAAGRTAQTQLMMSKTAQVASEIKAQVNQWLEKSGKYTRKDFPTKVGADANEQIRSLMARFGLGVQLTAQEQASRMPLANYIEIVADAGYPMAVPAWVMSEAYNIPYQDLTVGQFFELANTIDTLATVARKIRAAEDAENKESAAYAAKEMGESITELAHETKKKLTPQTRREINLAKGLSLLEESLRIPSGIIRILDGNKSNGIVWQYLARTANERGSWESEQRAKVAEFFAHHLEPIFGAKIKEHRFLESLNKKVYVPELIDTRFGGSLSYSTIVGIVLNMGNEGNLKRLLSGEGWTIEQAMAAAQKLTAAELRSIQEVWNMFESYRPQIAALERKLYGTEPKWVEYRPLTIMSADGEEVTLKGGYYPVRYDPSTKVVVGHRTPVDRYTIDPKTGVLSLPPMTAHGHTMERAEDIEPGQKLLLDATTMLSAMDSVIHDLAWREWVIKTNRMTRSAVFRAPVEANYGVGFLNQIDSWVEDIAIGSSIRNDSMDWWANTISQNISVASIGYNLLSFVKQFTGLLPGISRLGDGDTRRGALLMRRGLDQYLKNPKAAMAFVQMKSATMDSRMKGTQFRELHELRNMMHGESKIRREMLTYAYYLTSMSQFQVDTVVWLSKYQEMTGAVDDDTAVQLADQAVIDSQGSGMRKDLSHIERQQGVKKLFTTFMNYKFTQLNLLASSYMSTDELASKISTTAMVLVLPTLMDAIVKSMVTPSAGGDDDDYLEKLARSFPGDVLSETLGMFVFGREAVSAMDILSSALEDKAVSRSYSGPTGLRLFSDLQAAAGQVRQGDIDKALIKSLIKVIGDLTGIPSVQINRMIDGTEALLKGDTENPLALPFGVEKK